MSFIKYIPRYISYSFGRILRETGLALDARGSRNQKDIAYLEPLSRHRKIQPIWTAQPAIYDSAVIAENASLIGEVVIGDKTQIGYGVVARGEYRAVRIGHNCVVGDNTVIQTVITRLPAGIPESVNIGNNVQIGDGCVLSSCIIDDNASIGSRVLILDGAVVERGAVVEDDTVVPPGRVIPAGQVWGGSPARYIRRADGQIEEHSHDEHHHDEHHHEEHHHGGHQQHQHHHH